LRGGSVVIAAVDIRNGLGVIHGDQIIDYRLGEKIGVWVDGRSHWHDPILARRDLGRENFSGQQHRNRAAPKTV
jgi:hypothetical protein